MIETEWQPCFFDRRDSRRKNTRSRQAATAPASSSNSSMYQFESLNPALYEPPLGPPASSPSSSMYQFESLKSRSIRATTGTAGFEFKLEHVSVREPEFRSKRTASGTLFEFRLNSSSLFRGKGSRWIDYVIHLQIELLSHLDARLIDLFHQTNRLQHLK